MTAAAALTTDGGTPVEVMDSASDDHGHLHAQHGGSDGHLEPSKENVRLVGRMRINQDQGERVADVGVLGNYAYLAAWAAPSCQKGGVYVFDISNPARPKQINFIRTANDSYAGEGVHVVQLSTSAWTGNLLAFNNEDCTDNAGNTSKHSIGGATFVDVTNPKVHKYLAQGVGDRTTGQLGAPTEADAHEIHSIFVWEDENGTASNADDKAYAVIVDNEESYDVDILDITNPASPVLIAEHDLNVMFPQIVQSGLGTAESFLHDMIVKEINGHYVMLVSYWDGGYVTLNVDDPANPTYIGDSDFPDPDEVLNAAVDPDPDLPPEGNAHQAEFSLNNDFIVAADEDFDAYKPFLSVAGGAPKPFSAGLASEGVPFGAGDTVTGPTRYVGLACNSAPPPAATSADQIAVIQRGACAFQEKLDNVTSAGYAAAIVFNSSNGSPPCDSLLNMLATSTIPAFFVGRSVGFAILGEAYDPAACAASTVSTPIGDSGEPIEISFKFDGWGYVRLFENGTGKLTELDTYAVPQAHDPAYATGYGDLSVHEVAMSHVKNDLAYFSYYSAGFRVARIVGDELVEVGHYIDHADEGGSNFWGVQVWKHGGKEYVLASDRDYGVYIFEYTGPGNANTP